MSRMFHRVLATSVIGAAAMAAPLTAMAADAGCGTGPGAGAETPTAVVVHLPKHVEADEPVTVTARITPQQAAQAPTGAQPGKDKDGKGEGKDHKGRHKDKTGQGDDGQEGKDGTGTKGDEPGKDGHHGHKGAGHGKKGKKHHKKGAGQARRHAVTGEVEFFLDGKAEPPVEVSRGQASEKIQIPLGRHTIYAEYSGDGNFESAKSAPVTFQLSNDQDAQGGQDSQGAQSDQGTQSGQDQDGPVGTSTQTGLDNPAMDQTDPDVGRDSGDLTPGEQDQSDWGQDSDDQDGPQDED